MALIYYHVDWPDYDSMNVKNPTEVATEVSYYGVTGVPQSNLDGVLLSSTVTQSNITTDYAVAAPFTIRMIHQVSNGKIAVQMVIKKTATTTGTYAAKIAVIEKTMTYTSPTAGTNGETTFPNVFKKFLPDPNGITLASMNVGDSVTIMKSWSYSHVKNISNLEAVGFLQNTSDKTIPQAAYSVAGTIPANADFAASLTNAQCVSKQITFTDQSYLATSWAWDFGDGGTSNLQNPTHTYAASGSYTVTLAINSAASTATKNNYITISLPAAPTTTNGSGSTGTSVTLSATGSGLLKWYTTPTGGTHIAKGNTYITPPLTTTTNYYVEDNVSQTVQSVGMAAKGTTGGYYTATGRQGLLFDTYAPLTIQSVTVYEQTAGSRTIWLKNSSGTYLDSITTSVSSGTQSVTLGWSVPTGTGYTLGAAAANNFWRETSGPVYPYSLSNVMSVTGSTAGSSYYYYFYNWQVKADSCISPRAIVTADIITGINDKDSHVNYNLYPNPNTGEFILNISSLQNQNITINLVDINGKIVYSDQLNLKGEINKKFDFAGYSKGVYFMRIITNKEVYNKKVIIE